MVQARRRTSIINARSVSRIYCTSTTLSVVSNKPRWLPKYSMIYIFRWIAEVLFCLLYRNASIEFWADGWYDEKLLGGIDWIKTNWRSSKLYQFASICKCVEKSWCYLYWVQIKAPRLFLNKEWKLNIIHDRTFYRLRYDGNWLKR